MILSIIECSEQCSQQFIYKVLTLCLSPIKFMVCLAIRVLPDPEGPVIQICVGLVILTKGIRADLISANWFSRRIIGDGTNDSFRKSG
jgi:hypothetical protein